MEAPAMVKNPKSFWLFWGSVAAIWQAFSLKKHNGGTWSETTRALWKVETKVGRYAFLASFYLFLLGLAAWFPKHIIRPVMSTISAIAEEVNDDDNQS